MVVGGWGGWGGGVGVEKEPQVKAGVRPWGGVRFMCQEQKRKKD